MAEIEPLESRIQRYVERVELAPDSTISLSDIAPFEEWEAEIGAGHGPYLAEAFFRTTVDILRQRYPKTDPFPFDRLYAVGQHEGWWIDEDKIPYELVIRLFAQYAKEGTNDAERVLVPLDGTGRATVLRAILSVTLAIFRAAQGHPAYRG